jgi:hypothetical protein
MTEEQARTKWCPMVRFQHQLGTNRDACFDHAGTHCIGSDCMMWRWDVEACREGPEVDHGYCGLAGKL